MSKVFIGVGHGGSDAGAVDNGLKEKEINLSIALHLREELQRLIAADPALRDRKMVLQLARQIAAEIL